MAFQNPVTVASAVTGDTNPKVLTYNGVPGRTYLLFLGRYLAADSFTAVTDSAGNTWTRLDYAPKSGTTGRRIEVWKCTPTAPFTSVTATQNNTGFGTASLVEIQGGSGNVNAVLALERASSTTPAAVTITPTKANTLVLAAIQANTNTTSQITPSAGWTNLGSAAEGPEIVYQHNPPSGSPVGVSWTLATAQGSGHAIVALEDSGPWFLWDGTTEVPLNLEGTYNGVSIDPCMFDTVVGAPTEPQPGMLVGLDCLPGNTASDFAAFPGVMYHRHFGDDDRYGTDADALTEPTQYGVGLRWQNLPSGAVMHISWKDDPNLFSDFLDTLPTNDPTFPGVYVSPWHEPHDEVRDGAFTAATFRSWGQTLTNIKNSHPNGHLVLGIGPILTRYDLDEAPTRANPGDYGWSGMDFFGVDCYQSATNVPYYDTEKMFGFVFDRIHAVYPGIPLMIPEYGIVRNTGTDPTGANRAQTITNHIAYLRNRGDVLAIAYFNEIGVFPGVPLDDTPSADAWRAALASQ